MNKNELKDYRPGQIISLSGFTSTSKSFNIALDFSIDEPPTADLASVVYDINFHGSKGLFDLSNGYSSFNNEEEVLIQDGL